MDCHRAYAHADAIGSNVEMKKALGTRWTQRRQSYHGSGSSGSYDGYSFRLCDLRCSLAHSKVYYYFQIMMRLHAHYLVRTNSQL
jgi:hypothetical protein